MWKSNLPPKAAYDRAAIGCHDAIKAIQQSYQDGVITLFASNLRYEWLRREFGQAGGADRQWSICRAVIEMCELDYKVPNHAYESR